MYLYRYYPKAFYPAEIAQNTGVAPRSILGGLKGMGRLDASNSLIKKKLVEEVEQENATYYRLSEHGKSLVESMRCQKAFI
jgi:predicted transcriptional regulator with HTH domain